jgi:dihydroorotase
MTRRREQLLVRGTAAEADLMISGAHLIDPRAGIDGVLDVIVSDGQLAEIGEPGTLSAGPDAEKIDGSGFHLFPAFVDPHIHLRTPGHEHKEDIETGTRSAAAGGFCSVLAMPNTDPVVDSASVMRSLREAARREARVPVGFLAAITVGLKGQELTAMSELRAAGAAGFTDDGMPVESAGMLRKALQYQQMSGGVLALHEEDPSLSAGGSMNEGAVNAVLGIGGIPSTSESTMVARDAALAGYEGGTVHMQHLSCAESVEAIREAKRLGYNVTTEVSPHHLCFTEEEVRTLDTRMKMNPPLRTEADRQALIAGLIDGTIDCIATDHAPHSAHEKEVPFEQAPMGTTGLESSFAACYTELVRSGLMSIEMLIEKMTCGGAIFGLQIPQMTIGESANLVLVDLEQEWRVGEDGYESRSENCAFGGRKLHGRVLLTVADGAVAYRQRSFALSAAPDLDEAPQ